VDPTSLSNRTMIGLVMVAYNAGPGTVRKAMGYAIEAGDLQRWMEPEHFQRALIYYGAYSVSTSLRGAVRAMDGETLLRELCSVTGQGEAAMRNRYYQGERWNMEGMTSSIIEHVNRERRELRRQNLTLEQVRTRASRWILQATEFKHNNLREWYIDRVHTYMRYFEETQPVPRLRLQEPTDIGEG
jgi:hypothetical protein